MELPPDGEYRSVINNEVFIMKDNNKIFEWRGEEYEVSVINEYAFSVKLPDCKVEGDGSVKESVKDAKRFYYYYDVKAKSWNEVVKMGNVERNPCFDEKIRTSERNFWIEEEAGFFYYFSKKLNGLHIEIFGGDHHNIFKLKKFSGKTKRRVDESDDEEDNDDLKDKDYIEEIEKPAFNDSEVKAKEKKENCKRVMLNLSFLFFVYVQKI